MNPVHMMRGRHYYPPPMQPRVESGNRWGHVVADLSSSNQSASSSSCNNPSSAESYFSREEIDRCSPSRRDGIDVKRETHLRHSYSSFIQNLGMRLQLPQTTMATAMILCHRFFLRRSHAAYDRFIIATACLFLASKLEESPRPINTVVLASYEICHRKDLLSFHYDMPKDWFVHFKEGVIEAEQCVLTTLNFELSVEHPYKPFLDVLRKIGLAGTAIVNVGRDLVTDALCGSLCLQFEPNHIAAGATFLAARALAIDLPSNTFTSWWQEFHTTPAILDMVVLQMLERYG